MTLFAADFVTCHILLFGKSNDCTCFSLRPGTHHVFTSLPALHRSVAAAPDSIHRPPALDHAVLAASVKANSSSYFQRE